MVYVLTDYVEQALAEAVYNKVEDGSFVGHIPSCHGVVAFGAFSATARTSSIQRWKTGFCSACALDPGFP